MLFAGILWGIRLGDLPDSNGGLDYSIVAFHILCPFTCAVLATLLMVPSIWLGRKKQQWIAELEANQDADPDEVM